MKNIVENVVNSHGHEVSGPSKQRLPQELRGSKALVASIPNCLKPTDATGPTLPAVAHIMEILHEGGYDCELVQETLH